MILYGRWELNPQITMSETVAYTSSATSAWWRWRESNPHAFRHWSLKPACIPIPAHPRIRLQPYNDPLLGYNLILVLSERLELSHLTALDPKSSVSTNSTTRGKFIVSGHDKECLSAFKPIKPFQTKDSKQRLLANVWFVLPVGFEPTTFSL